MILSVYAHPNTVAFGSKAVEDTNCLRFKSDEWDICIFLGNLPPRLQKAFLAIPFDELAIPDTEEPLLPLTPDESETLAKYDL